MLQWVWGKDNRSFSYAIRHKVNRGMGYKSGVHSHASMNGSGRSSRARREGLSRHRVKYRQGLGAWPTRPTRPSDPKPKTHSQKNQKRTKKDRDQAAPPLPGGRLQTNGWGSAFRNLCRNFRPVPRGLGMAELKGKEMGSLPQSLDP